MPTYTPKFESVRTRLVHHIDYKDFEEVVFETYGQPFEFALDQEASNDTSHSFDRILKQDDLDEHQRLGMHERAELGRFIDTGRGYFVAQTLLFDLVDHGVLPDGDYIVRVSW